MERQIYVYPHHAGGFWIADRNPDGSLSLLSGRFENLSEHQVNMRLDRMRERGEVVTVSWDDTPDAKVHGIK